MYFSRPFSILTAQLGWLSHIANRDQSARTGQQRVSTPLNRRSIWQSLTSMMVWMVPHHTLLTYTLPQDILARNCMNPADVSGTQRPQMGQSGGGEAQEGSIRTSAAQRWSPPLQIERRARRNFYFSFLCIFQDLSDCLQHQLCRMAITYSQQIPVSKDWPAKGEHTLE